MANLSTLVPAPRILTPSPPNAGDQNNAFIDSSPNSFTITRNGNTTQGTFSPYGDRWSNYFDGTGDYLTAPDNAAFAFGTGDFTIEYWVYAISFSNTQTIFDTRASTAVVTGYSDYFGNTGSFNLFLNNTTIYTSASNVALNSWTHIAVSRSGTSIRVFINGTQSGSAVTNSSNLTDQKCSIGVNINRVSYHNGYISNLRVLKGTALYTANFTPSTTPLTAITDTSLLTCQSNRFRDASTNNFTITRNGDVSVQRFSPFAPVAPYSVSTIGGSGYFDGTGDYLTVPDNAAFDFGTGDFTIELWVYIAGNSSLNSISTREVTVFGSFPTSAVGSLTNSWGFNLTGSGTTTGVGLNFSNWQSGSNSVISATVTIPQTSWNHIAVARSGTTTKLFLNGAEVGSGTLSNQTVNSGQNLAVGRLGYPGYIQELNGYISNLRVLKGTAQYTGSYTIPAAPFTAITNTSLLLNFTNAGIRDDAMMADLETVGNAQISTTVKKYGTGSLYFDGTGDYLSAPFDLGRVFGTGDFTIEYWINPISNASGCMVDLRSTELGAGGVAYSDYFATGGKLGIYISGNTYVSTSTVPTGQWTHIAVSRSGTALRVFFNGMQDGSTVANSQNLVGGPLKVGINVALNGPFNGYLDDLRITKGVARYTANFTPPQTSLPVDKDTVLLLDGDGTPNSNIQVDTYTTTGTVHTWTKPYGAKAVMINIRGAGGGGGGGQGGAAGTARVGGGGGGGGARIEQICTPDVLPSTLYVIVGAGGTGGTGGSSAAGTNGTAGGNSFVSKNNTNPPVTGIVAFAGGGGGGSGGFQASTCGGGGGGGSSGQGATSVGAGVVGGFPGGASTYLITGGAGAGGGNQDSGGGHAEWGGGGGGANRLTGDFSTRSGGSAICGSGAGSGGRCIAAGNGAQTLGGWGGNSGFISDTTGAAAGANGTTGSTGTAGASYLATGNGGGGGGAGGAGTGGTGGIGGAGGLGGGGGGGGGAGTTVGGNGGAGGNGVVEIITYF